MIRLEKSALVPSQRVTYIGAVFSVGQRNCLSNIRQNSENRTRNFSDNPGTNSTQFPSPSGFNGFMHRADSECSVIYETDTTPSSAVLETSYKGSPSKSPNNSTSVGSLEMVAKSRESVESETILPRSKFKNSYYRCLQARVRRSPRKSHLSGYVVQRRTKVTHKSSGTESSSFVTPEISAHLKGHSVLVRSDNTTVVQYLNKQGGTKSPQLCLLTCNLLQLAIKNNVTMKAAHIIGSLNILADDLSRVKICPTERTLNNSVTQILFRYWARQW